MRSREGGKSLSEKESATFEKADGTEHQAANAQQYF